MSSWFQSTNIASLAKNALKEAQKTIDKALDINQEHSSEDEPVSTSTHNHNQVNHLSDLTNTVTGAATDFFSTWGVSGILKEKQAHDAQNAPQSDNTKSKEIVVTAPPNASSKSLTGKKPRTRVRRKSSNSSRTTMAVEDTGIAAFTELSLSDGEHTVENETNIQKKDINRPDPPASFNFQPLWLDVEDQDQPNVSSSDIMSLTTEPNVLLPAGDLAHPFEQGSTSHAEVKQSDTTDLEEAPSVEIEVPTGMLIDTDADADNNDKLPEIMDQMLNIPESAPPAVTESSTSEDDDTNRQRMNSESDTNTLTVTDLESSSATTIMQDSRDNSDENNPTEFSPEIEQNPDVENGGIDRDASPTLLSPSSRAMSSVSEMSEKHSQSEFDSRSPTNSNNSGPSSPNPDHGTDSQILISIKQSALANGHPLPHLNPQKSSSSTPERGHSRSNSNSTSSSIDQQHHGQSHMSQTMRSHVPLQQNHIHSQGGRIVANFPLSSASSSDIEVISLDSSMYHAAARRPSFAEVETQTDAVDTPSPAIHTKMSALLTEKEAEIAQLREEGEKLSKKQFDLTTIIKKLRAKEKETEGIIKGLKNEIDTKSIEVERVTKTFLQKESIEQKQVQTIAKLNNEKAMLEDTIGELKSKLEDSTENCASMKASLEDASIEILELQNTIASAQHDTTQIDTLTREKSDLSQQNQSFKRELEQLRSSLSTVQAKSSAREQELKAQIVEQAQAIQSLETQLGDMTNEIADATMPLSIEIEKLQSELKANELQFQKRERQLNDQLLEMNLKRKQALEREKSSQDYQTDYKSSIRKLETQVERLESDNNALSLEIRNLKDENVAREKTREEVEAQLLDQKNELNKSKFIIEKLEADVKTQTTLYEVEKKKCSHLLEQLRQYQQNEQSASGANESGSTSPTQTTLRANRSPTMSEASYLEEVFESSHMNNNIGNTSHHSLHNHTGTLTPKSSSIFDSLPIYNQASGSPYFETLYAQLRQRENELIQLQTDSGKNEKIRKTLNDEIAKLTVENQQLDAKLEQLTDVQNRLSEVEKNYNAVLQLYGEKVEEVEELRMDLADVKEMYKTQIEQLVKK